MTQVKRGRELRQSARTADGPAADGSGIGKPAAEKPSGEKRSVGRRQDHGSAASTVRVGGEVEFDPGIIADIALREASVIEGIAELTGGWRTKGVSVGEAPVEGGAGDGGEPGYVVDLRIAVEYGVNCVALAETIRNRIGNAIRQMTGRQTVAVNVHVTGVRDRGMREEPHEETGPLGEEHGMDF